MDPSGGPAGGLMRVPGPERWSSRTFWAVLVGMTAAAGLLRLPWVDRGLNENTSFRQTQTAFTVREYMRNGIDLLHAPMPVLGPPWDLPFELPLFQALAAVVGRLGLDSTTAARLTGLVFFQLTCLALAVLALRWFSRATALLTVVLFQLSPFGVQWGSASLIEFLATACSVGAVVVVDVWSTRRRPVWLVLAVVLQVLAFLVKPTTAVPWLVAYAVPVARMVLDAPTSRARATVAAWASAPPLAGLVAAVLWTRHADDIKAASPFTEGLTSRSLMTWNFGTPGQRLDPAAWGLVFGRVGSISG
ncbi:MAG TPA: glycosyltransferase family 39 protein, partial [Actinomycetes bacterium]|nr:glycosyltransferase family 39 protein [Actinomycetes bacterium]